MSGLVTGLQNRAQRFESASDLQRKHLTSWGAFLFVGSMIRKRLPLTRVNGNLIYLCIFRNEITL